MLFYSQIKRKFSQSIWKHGQTYFWEDRVRSVRMNGSQIIAKIVEPAEPSSFQETTIIVTRGSLSDCRCSCGQLRLREAPCKHVAALCIWVVEKGSLLRAGVLSGNGVNREALEQDLEDEEELEEAAPAIEFVSAEPVTFVRPIFEDRALTGITLEPALRFTHPETGKVKVEGLHTLAPQLDFAPKDRVWKNAEDLLLKIAFEIIPVLGSIDAARVSHIGQATLENLAMLLSMPDRSRLVFHPALQIEFDNEPLKLSALHVGKKVEAGRVLSYQFTNSRAMLTSEQVALLSTKGYASSRYVWPVSDFNPLATKATLYRFETPLTLLSRYANRSGLAVPETKNRARAPEGYTFLEDDPQHPLHPLAAYRLSLELGVKRFTVDPDWNEFHEWRKHFERKKYPGLPKVEYGFSLRDYQSNGLSWLWSLYHRGLSALLADEMGLGKTHQVLAFLTSLYSGKKSVNPTLVVAPTSVVAAWVQKLEKYPTGLRWMVFHGKARVAQFSGYDLVLTTYGILQKESALRQVDWETVVLDEAQAIKNATTISNRASRVLKSRFRIAMTGTPVENQSTDLWSVMEFLLPGYLGSLPRFKRLYGAGREAPNASQAEALKRLISPFLLRRTKSQVLKELPEKTEETIPCELTPKQRQVYRDYLRSSEATKLRSDIEGGSKIDYAGILAMLTRLKQVCDHWRLPDLTSGRIKHVKSMNPMESGKWEAFEEILNEALGSNLKVVVFSQYLGMLDMMSHYLEKREIGFAVLQGATQDRATPLREFADNPDCRVFLCSLLAGGLGIDLTSASVCIHFDRWWNPAKENQATDRLHRIGQTRGVQVFKLQCPGTIEDRIASIIESKVNLSSTLIEESPLGLKAFSRKELLQLLSDVE